MMDFRTLAAAALSGGLLITAALAATAQQAATPPGKALVHPWLRTALDWHDPKRWSAEITEYDFRLRCKICGQDSRTHMVIARMTNLFPENLDAALAMATRAHAKAYKLKLGEVRRTVIADGAPIAREDGRERPLEPVEDGRERPFSPSKTSVNALVAWTEQPGSPIPFVGAVKRGTEYFFVWISARESMTAGHDDLRNDFLAMAGSVRPWDGL